MLHRRLGRSDLDVSVISFGCMSLGQDQADNERVIHRALDLGINMFDTADMYAHGDNEVSLGKALQGRRQSVAIATKVGNQWRPDGSGWDWNPSRSYIENAVHESLKRLGTDYIDLYQLHGGTIDDPMDETVEAFESLKVSGAIRHYGISSIRPNVIAAWLKRSGIVSVMMQYSLLDRRPEEQCLGWLRDADVGVLVRGGLAKGLLAGKPSAAYLDHDVDAVGEVQQRLASMAGETTPGHTAIGYCLAHPAVTSVACGIRTLSQLEDNAAAADRAALEPADIEALRARAPASRYEAHRTPE